MTPERFDQYLRLLSDEQLAALEALNEKHRPAPGQPATIDAVALIRAVVTASPDRLRELAASHPPANPVAPRDADDVGARLYGLWLVHPEMSADERHLLALKEQAAGLPIRTPERDDDFPIGAVTLPVSSRPSRRSRPLDPDEEADVSPGAKASPTPLAAKIEELQSIMPASEPPTPARRRSSGSILDIATGRPEPHWIGGQ